METFQRMTIPVLQKDVFSLGLQVLMERPWCHVTQRAKEMEDEKATAEFSEVEVVHFSSRIVLFGTDVGAGG